jgi:hypothetical protein
MKNEFTMLMDQVLSEGLAKIDSMTDEELEPMGPEANYDLNIWNKGADESTMLPEDEYYDEWWICPYEITAEGSYYGTGREREDLNFKLTAEEANRLTLGWGGPDQIFGDYTPDYDFFLDKNSFLDIYKDIPTRVREYLDSLPKY